MNNKVNYTLVGLFVLIGIVLMSVFVYWMLKPSGDAKKQKYAIYFDESVSGLNLNAAVKFRGIAIGQVVKLEINPKNSEQVRVIIDILKTTPINDSTAAKLTPQGITGLTYVNLVQGKNKAAPLTVQEGQKYPVIKTVPSLFVNIENSLGNVTNQLSSTLNRTDQLLGEKKPKTVSSLVEKDSKYYGKSR
jgi:phospholipid/cholesterol/gamma-HCH transport system substrate-binding protein